MIQALLDFLVALPRFVMQCLILTASAAFDLIRDALPPDLSANLPSDLFGFFREVGSFGALGITLGDALELAAWMIPLDAIMGLTLITLTIIGGIRLVHWIVKICPNWIMGG